MIVFSPIFAEGTKKFFVAPLNSQISFLFSYKNG